MAGRAEERRPARPRSVVNLKRALHQQEFWQTENLAWAAREEDARDLRELFRPESRTAVPPYLLEVMTSEVARRVDHEVSKRLSPLERELSSLRAELEAVRKRSEDLETRERERLSAACHQEANYDRFVRELGLTGETCEAQPVEYSAEFTRAMMDDE